MGAQGPYDPFYAYPPELAKVCRELYQLGWMARCGWECDRIAVPSIGAMTFVAGVSSLAVELDQVGDPFHMLHVPKLGFRDEHEAVFALERLRDRLYVTGSIAGWDPYAKGLRLWDKVNPAAPWREPGWAAYR